MPTTVYSSDLEGLTPGNAIPGWTALSGVFVSQNAAGGGRPVSGTIASLTQSTTGNTAFYSTMSAIADVDFQSSHKVKITTGDAAVNHHLLRAVSTSGTAMTTGYRVAITYSGGNYAGVLLKTVLGTTTNLGSGTGTPLAVADGDTCNVATTIVGTTINLYMWKTGSRPGSPTYTWTDSAIPGAGVVGVYAATATGTQPSSDDFIIVDLSSAAATSLLPPPRGQYFNNLLSV